MKVLALVAFLALTLSQVQLVEGVLCFDASFGGITHTKQYGCHVDPDSQIVSGMLGACIIANSGTSYSTWGSPNDPNAPYRSYQADVDPLSWEGASEMCKYYTHKLTCTISCPPCADALREEVDPEPWHTGQFFNFDITPGVNQSWPADVKLPCAKTFELWETACADIIAAGTPEAENPANPIGAMLQLANYLKETGLGKNNCYEVAHNKRFTDPASRMDAEVIRILPVSYSVVSGEADPLTDSDSFIPGFPPQQHINALALETSGNIGGTVGENDVDTARITAVDNAEGFNFEVQIPFILPNFVPLEQISGYSVDITSKGIHPFGNALKRVFVALKRDDKFVKVGRVFENRCADVDAEDCEFTSQVVGGRHFSIASLTSTPVTPTDVRTVTVSIYSAEYVGDFILDSVALVVHTGRNYPKFLKTGEGVGKDNEGRKSTISLKTIAAAPQEP